MPAWFKVPTSSTAAMDERLMKLEHAASHDYESSEREPWLGSRDAGLIRVPAESLKFQKL